MMNNIFFYLMTGQLQGLDKIMDTTTFFLFIQFNDKLNYLYLC